MALPFMTVIARNVLVDIVEQAPLLATVNVDWSPEVASKGDTVKILQLEDTIMQDAGGAFSPVAIDPTVKDVVLDKWRENKPLVIDKASFSKFGDPSVLRRYAAQIGMGMGAEIDTAILTVANAIAQSVGTATTGTVDPASLAAFHSYKAKFDALEAPKADRFVIAGADLQAAYLNVFGEYNVGGQTGVDETISGYIGKKIGMNFVENSSVQNGTTKQLGVAYHRNAIIFASRPMAAVVAPHVETVTETYKGVSFTLESWYDVNTSNLVLRGQLLYGLKALTSKGFKIYKAAA